MQNLSKMILRILFLFLFLLIELYSFQAVKTLVKIKWVLITYQIISAQFSFTYSILLQNLIGPLGKRIKQHNGYPTIDLCSKACCFLLHVRRGLLEWVQEQSTILDLMKQSFLNSRRKFISQIGLGLQLLPFIVNLRNYSGKI
jgi:hypothetical protein